MPPAARCSSTRSASCRRGPRPSCCASCRTGGPARRRERVAPRRRARRRGDQPAARTGGVAPAGFARTCASGSTSSASKCRRCAIAPSDVPLLAAHFWSDAAARMGSRATLSPDGHRGAARATTGPATSASCRTSSPGWPWTRRRRGRVGPAALRRISPTRPPSLSGTFEAAREEFERRFVQRRARARRRSARRAPPKRSGSAPGTGQDDAEARNCEDGVRLQLPAASFPQQPHLVQDFVYSSHLANWEPGSWKPEARAIYLVRRLLLTIPVLLGVATLVFALIHLVPGDPAEAMLGESGLAGGPRRTARTGSASIGRCLTQYQGHS